MFGLFGDPKKREGRTLGRDAPTIIEQARQSYPASDLRDIAGIILREVPRAHEVYGTSEIDLKRAAHDIQQVVRDARRRNDQIAFTAMTLILIYLRSEIIGPWGGAARQAIDEFTDEWAHTAPDSAEPNESGERLDSEEN